ncbi:hypothetical protein CEXT_74501 [Caerostris extrusa]|uniref:Oxysterol-binding protein n=1 Tax=Caerostris extrusa TaxID=172846 RepID=A0AAV4VDC5_CAEEX|nr:hypothetical protein CEXT_74501 [Caerostris extrusa]
MPMNYSFNTREDLGFRLVCEQVSHHPPVSAFHAESEDFQFYGNIHPPQVLGEVPRDKTGRNAHCASPQVRFRFLYSYT